MVELDGGQHAIQGEADQERAEFLAEHGYQVLRFWDNEVFENLDGVLHRILEALINPHPDPLPGREREKNA